MSVAVIGSSSFVTCFELIGAQGFEAENGKQISQTLLRIIEDDRFKLIILPERFAAETLPIRESVTRMGKFEPVFALLPDLTMQTGMRMEELKSVVSLAIGAKLEL